MQTVVISLSEEVRGGRCLATEDGKRIYERISDALHRGDRVVLSFEGVTRITTAFLNAAVGQLYGEFSEREIRNGLGKPENVQPWQLELIKIVTDRAKVYFADREKYESILKSVSGGADEDI